MSLERLQDHVFTSTTELESEGGEDNPMKIVIVGSGVAGSEAGTYLGYKANRPLEIVEIESEPTRRFGGWGFQGFPLTERTNLALKKMYLGENLNEFAEWIQDPEQRSTWPEALESFEPHLDRPVPRALIQLYVRWRRAQVHNTLVTYTHVTGEAMKVRQEQGALLVELHGGELIQTDKLIMASGSIAVKIPEYLMNFRDHVRVIIDPLTLEGHERRQEIPKDARVLILGTGLTGEEQANILFRNGHTHLTILSRNGQRHYAYNENQKNLPLALDEAPDFLKANTEEEFKKGLADFFQYFFNQGHCQEDILAALRPHWDNIRADLGGCKKAAERIRRSRRSLATHSIGTSFEVSQNLKKAQSLGFLKVIGADITSIADQNGTFKVEFQRDKNVQSIEGAEFDYIINAVGRNIIQHPIWEDLLERGIAKKHAGIGIRVSDIGQMVDAQGRASEDIWVVGMARAGDHALRHGYLGNTAFNVPQVRAHLYKTIDAMLARPSFKPA